MIVMKSSCLMPVNRILYVAFCPNRVKSEDRIFLYMYRNRLAVSNLNFTDRAAQLVGGRGFRDDHLLK